jgi:tRNA (guanine-N7-)-methyltransferase
VSEIWITFPDPRPKDRDEKRRLTYPKFMNWYKSMMHADGWVKFKTDNTELFDYTLAMINSGEILVRNLVYTHDLYHSPLLVEHQGIQTRFEKMFSEKGETIKYMRFQFQ